MYYVLDENKNLVEALDKEGVEALLARAIQEGQLPSVDEDTAFVTMLKDPITGASHKIVMCSQAKFNEMKEADQLIPNAYYFITDDTTAEDLEAHLVENDARVSDLEERATAIENRERYFIGTVTPTEGLEGLLELCRAYWVGGGASRECFGTIVGSVYYFKEGSNDMVVYFDGYDRGYATYSMSTEDWTITYVGASKSIDPTSDITQTGLYAVSYRIGLDQGAVTWMLSVFTLEDGTRSFDIEGTSLSVSQGVFTANFSYSTKKITIMCKKNGNTTFLEPSDIHLIAKY